MEVTGGLVYAKSLWTVISGTHLRATYEVVKHELEKSTELFSKGLTSFRPPNDESDKKLESKFSPQFYKFVISLRKFLGIDALQAWDLLSNYLLYEFQGAEVGLQAFLVNDEKTNMLMTDIWMFYHSERLFLLKCINLVLTYCKDTDHPYQETLSEFLSQFSVKDFTESLLTQLNTVTNEPYPHRDVHGQLMTDQYQLRWQNYNLREQIEVLHNMIVYVDMNEIDLSLLPKIVKICIDCRFGKQEEYKVRNTALAKYYGDIIGYLQNILLLQHLNFLAYHVLESRETPMNIEEFVSSLGEQEEQMPFFMSVVLIKSFECYGDTTSTIFEKLGEMAMSSGAFEYLRKLVSSDMFQDNNKLSDIAFNTIYDFVSLFVNNFEVEAFYHIRGLLNLVGPILKHKSVVERFWTSEKGIITLLYVLSERFPFDYLPLIEAVDSLAKYGPNHFNDLTRFLTDTGRFAENLDGSPQIDSMVQIGPAKWQSTVSYKPLRYSNFSVPAGTKGRFIDEDIQLFCWHCEFVVFDAVYNELRNIVEQISSVEHYVNPKTQANVVASLRFLRSYLSNADELTLEAVGCVNYILTIISKLKNVFCVSTLVLALCLDILVILLPKFPEEILRRLRLLDVLPTVQMVPKNFIFIFDGEYFTPKTVGSVIQREECVCGEYPLLTSYLSFIYKLIKSEDNVEISVKKNVHVILPGVVFILADVYPNYQSWHFVDEKEHDIIAITCVKIFHEILGVTGTSKTNANDVTTPLQLVQNLVLYSFLNMKAGKVLLKIVSAGEAYIQTKMEKKMNWVSGHGLSTVYLLQLNLSILNRVLLLKSQVHDKNILCTLENDIYCSPKENLQVIPIVASYINNSFSPILPVLAVKVLRRFALDMPKTLLACLGMESDVLREMIFRRLNSRIDSNRLKVALLQLVSACVDTQPGMCDAFFNLPLEASFSSSDISLSVKQSKPEFLKRGPIKDNTKGGCLVFVCAVLGKVQKQPDLISLPLYGAAVDLICSLWLGENSAAVEYLRNKENFWNLFCAPLFTKPQHYVYAFTQLFNIITLEIFHYGKNAHKDLLQNMEKFFNENSSFFGDWSKFVSDRFIQSDTEEPMEENGIQNTKVENNVWESVSFPEEEKKLPSQQMEKQPPSVQLLISWKRFVITSVKLLPFKIGNDQKVVLTRSIMNALQHEIQHMSLKPILLLVELYLVLITDWHEQFFDDKKIVKDQMKLMLKSCATTYQPLPRRVREAVLALALRAVDCLASEIQEDEVAAETMLQATTEIVLLELSDMGIPSQKTNTKLDNDEKPTDITMSLMHFLMPDSKVKKESTLLFRESLSGRLALSLLHKLLKILSGKTTWLQSDQLAEIRTAILRGLGRTLSQLHKQMNMFHFSVALNATNLVFFMIQNNIVDNSLDYQLPDNMWLQLIPPKLENKHWLSTAWPLLYKPSLEIITQHLQNRSFLFLENAISFVGMHDEYLVDAMLAFRHSLDMNMLELSMLALNLVRTLSFYPNHWKLVHDSSLSNIMSGVVTCCNMSVALLINPVLLKCLLEKSDQKVDQKISTGQTEPEPSSKIVAIHNQLLKLAYLCLTVLQSYTPRLVYLLTECVKSPIASRPVVFTNLDAPVFDYDAMTPLTFGTLITLANLCTQALSKGVRAPSPRPPVSSMRAGIGSYILSMDKVLTSAVFEITVEMITSQGLVYLLGDALPPSDKESLRRSLNTEMTFFIEFSKRTIREGISSYTLETNLQSLKMYLATTMKLPLLRNVPSDKSQSQHSKSRKHMSVRDSYPRSPSATPSKVFKDNSVPSPQKGASTSKGVSQTPSPSQFRTNGSKTPTDSSQCDFHLPLSEDFVKLIALVFSSIFDVFNAGFDMT